MKQVSRNQSTAGLAKAQLIAVSAIMITLLLGGALYRRWSSPRLMTVDSGSLVLMGTYGRIQVRCENEQIGQTALQSAMHALDQVNQCFNVYQPNSDLSQVNANAGQWVSVRPETAKVLQKALEYHDSTDRAFDITVAPLIALWKNAEKNNELPPPADITTALSLVGSEKIQIRHTAETGHEVMLPEGMTVVANALAKGWAVDRALDALRCEGVHAALVDIGGEVAGFGLAGTNKPWRVGIQDPFHTDDDHSNIIYTIDLRDEAVATSGNYRRYVSIAGKHYSHIIDPRTGQPADKLPSVTVIAPRTIDADALATAISVLGAKQGLALAQTLNVPCLIITGTAEQSQVVMNQPERFRNVQP